MLVPLHYNSTLIPYYIQRDGILFIKGCVVLSHTSSLIPTLLNEFHYSIIGGHSNFTKTYKCHATNFYRKAMNSHILAYIRHCEVYQCSNYQVLSPVDLFQQLLIQSLNFSNFKCELCSTSNVLL